MRLFLLMLALMALLPGCFKVEIHFHHDPVIVVPDADEDNLQLGSSPVSDRA